MAQTLDEGAVAPDFALADDSGALIELRDLRAKGPVVVFFYPKDDTFGCTQEVCAFRDQYADFTAAGCQVVGISSDTVASHKAFSARHKLLYPLLADDKAQVREAYGIKSTLGILPGRVTFVIDQAGVVRHRFSGQINIKAHIEKALQVVQNLNTAAISNPR